MKTMKKEFIQPTTTAIQIHPEQLLLTASATTPQTQDGELSGEWD